MYVMYVFTLPRICDCVASMCNVNVCMYRIVMTPGSGATGWHPGLGCYNFGEMFFMKVVKDRLNYILLKFHELRIDILRDMHMQS